MDKIDKESLHFTEAVTSSSLNWRRPRVPPRDKAAKETLKPSGRGGESQPASPAWQTGKAKPSRVGTARKGFRMWTRWESEKAVTANDSANTAHAFLLDSRKTMNLTFRDARSVLTTSSLLGQGEMAPTVQRANLCTVQLGCLISSCPRRPPECRLASWTLGRV